MAETVTVWCVVSPNDPKPVWGLLRICGGNTEAEAWARTAYIDWDDDDDVRQAELEAEGYRARQFRVTIEELESKGE